jgi:ankyrin repeat protein
MTSADDLFTAIDAGDRSQLAAILAAAPDRATARNAAGLSPVLYASYRGRGDLVPILRAANPALDVFDASAVGDAARVREVLEEDANRARAYTPDGFTALHFVAFFGGDPESAALLIDHGADVNAVARNPMRVTPLHSAAAGRHTAVAWLLIARGADVNATQEGGFTALHAAAQNGDIEFADFLLAHSADPQHTTDDGHTAADLAASAGNAVLAARLRR